ncbi:MAG: hypothetical protein A3K19_20735 [Lentisphaerae bacterium RIFOXYB12_FULL_65_16]|nr:MAG: hypothetical protein A3K18_19160 [Lentisphaerae bacterium RIFOXYA12_64_32]OGV85213.1 MAG: hypothetical protein A3K19_20735 [Lentisphaerae bacterium RIFOXYB12_FULL_65_16]
MRSVRYTLVADGPTDVLLLPVLNWLLGRHHCSPQGEWFDPRLVTNPPVALPDRIRRALDMLPCDLLFVHRDAERDDPGRRREEIRTAAQQAVAGDTYVCVVPVRMTEAWFLFEEMAIRRAAGVPDGNQPLNLPAVARAETIANPKRLLHDALRAASGRSGRRLRQFNVAKAQYRLGLILADFSPLRTLPAFRQLEADVRSFLANKG